MASDLLTSCDQIKRCKTKGVVIVMKLKKKFEIMVMTDSIHATYVTKNNQLRYVFKLVCFFQKRM